MNPANQTDRVLSLIGCLIIVAYGFTSTKHEWMLTTAFIFFAMSLVIGFRASWLPTDRERKTRPPTRKD